MALFKYFKRTEGHRETPSLTTNNTYTPGQQALLGKYAAGKVWNCHINELTARRLKCQYVEKIKEIAHNSSHDASVEVTALATKDGKTLAFRKEFR